MSVARQNIVSISGIAEAQAAFTNLERNVFTKASREFVTKIGRVAMRLMTKEILADNLYRTGALAYYESFKIPKLNKYGYYMAIAGPKHSKGAFIRVRRKGKNAGTALMAIPARYAHLVNSGTSHGVKPRHFVQRVEAQVKILAKDLAIKVYSKAASNG